MSKVFLKLNETKHSGLHKLTFRFGCSKLDQKVRNLRSLFSPLGKAQGLVIKELEYSSSLVPALILLCMSERL